MLPFQDSSVVRGARHHPCGWIATMCVAAACCLDGPALGQRPDTRGHVRELATYLDRAEIAEPVTYRQLAVYPVLVPGYPEPKGGWLTLDDAVARGQLEVRERGGGSVPVVVVHNRSREDYVFLMSGEVLSGGKQTRTIRRDVVLAPGQTVQLDVYCVEAHRWEGRAKLSGAGVMVPQSIQKELRRGTDQGRVWSEVARNNRALGAENATGSVELALKSEPVRNRLAEVRRAVMPRVPEGTRGFLFLDRGRAVGAEFFGSPTVARDLLPKLLDSYAVDCILIRPERAGPLPARDHAAAIDFFRQICRAGSSRTATPGSGAGIQTRSGRLLGDGVSLSGQLVHFGVQTRDRIVPPPKPLPITPRQSGTPEP